MNASSRNLADTVFAIFLLQLFREFLPGGDSATALGVAIVLGHLWAVFLIFGMSSARHGVWRRFPASFCGGFVAMLVVVTVRYGAGLSAVPSVHAGGWLLAQTFSWGLALLYWSTARTLPGHNRRLWHLPIIFGRAV